MLEVLMWVATGVALVAALGSLFIAFGGEHTGGAIFLMLAAVLAAWLSGSVYHFGSLHQKFLDACPDKGRIEEVRELICRVSTDVKIKDGVVQSFVVVQPDAAQ